MAVSASVGAPMAEASRLSRLCVRYASASCTPIRDVIVSRPITKEPRDYQKAGVTAIAAQQLFGSGVKLRPGQNVEYPITDSESSVPNDRVRAFALWEGWHGYDRQKYLAMLREAFEPFEISPPKPASDSTSRDCRPGDDWANSPLFAAA